MAFASGLLLPMSWLSFLHTFFVTLVLLTLFATGCLARVLWPPK